MNNYTHEINITWCIDDVLELAPKLTREQALAEASAILRAEREAGVSKGVNTNRAN